MAESIVRKNGRVNTDSLPEVDETEMKQELDDKEAGLRRAEMEKLLKGQQGITIPALDIYVIEIPIRSTVPLLMHHFCNPEKQLGPGKTPTGRKQKALRNPNEEAENALHRVGKDGYGIPAFAFKRAMVNSIGHANVNIFKNADQGVFSVIPDSADEEGRIELVKIQGAKHVVDARAVKNGRPPIQQAVMCYRPKIETWTATLRIEFVFPHVRPKDLVAIVQAAGYFNGVGSLRKQRGGNGEFGCWEVSDAKPIKVYRKAGK